MSKRHSTFMVIALFAAAYLLPLEVRPLFIPDETRYAEVPREMLVSGNWIVPRLNGLLYFEKPVMGYWLCAISQALFGQGNFAVRLPMALATGVSALFVFLLARSDEKPLRGPLAALIFLSFLEISLVGAFAVLDPILTAFLTGSLFFFYRAVDSSPGSRKEKIALLLAGLFCGLAFLTKGFLAFAVPGLTMAAFLLWQRRYLDLLRLAWLPLLAAGLVSLPWALAIHQQSPDFWRYFFWEEHIRRFTADNAQHKKGSWYFLATLPAVIFPWILALPAAASGLRQQKREGRDKQLFTFLLCWFLLPFLFFSLSSGKLLTYILPCLPPLAVLMAMGLCQTDDSRLLQKGAVAGMLFSGLILVIFIGLQIIGFRGFRPYDQTWKWLLLCGALAGMTALFSLSWRGRQTWQRLFAMGCAPLLLVVSLQSAMPELTLQKKAPGTFIQRQQQRLSLQTLVLSDEDLARAVCWYLQRDDIYLIGAHGELAYGINHADKQRHLAMTDIKQLIADHPGNVALFIRRRHMKDQFAGLPPAPYQDDNGPHGYIFLHY